MDIKDEGSEVDTEEKDAPLLDYNDPTKLYPYSTEDLQEAVLCFWLFAVDANISVDCCY